MAERELTNKEKKLAIAIAAGETQGAAYAEAYSAKASRATQRANGHRIAKKAHVAAEIKRLRSLPAVDDYAGIKKMMIRRLLEISENDARATARHHAIIALLKYAEEGAARHVPIDPETEIAALVRELTADVEAQVAIDWPCVKGQKNRRANQESATNQVIADEATTEVVAQITANEPGGAGRAARDSLYRTNKNEPAEVTDAGTQYFGPAYRGSSLDLLHATLRHSDSEAVLATPSGRPEPETNWPGEGKLSETEVESVTCSFEEHSAQRPRYEWRAVPGRFPPIKRRVLVKPVVR
jgi:hypothetical protein